MDNSAEILRLFSDVNPLNIQPIRDFERHATITNTPPSCIVIIGINQKDIRHRCKAPLDAGIEIDVVDLRVVLQKGRKKQLSRWRKIKLHSHQCQFIGIVRLRKCDIITLEI